MDEHFHIQAVAHGWRPLKNGFSLLGFLHKPKPCQLIISGLKTCTAELLWHDNFAIVKRREVSKCLIRRWAGMLERQGSHGSPNFSGSNNLKFHQNHFQAGRDHFHDTKQNKTKTKLKYVIYILNLNSSWISSSRNTMPTFQDYHRSFLTVDSCSSST